MSTIRTNSSRRVSLDHFEPSLSDDPQAQKKLRASLELIDYTAFAANREVLAGMIGEPDAAAFQRLAVATALAHGRWLAESLSLAGLPPEVHGARAQKLGELRRAYEELSGAYEALREAVERGLIRFTAPAMQR